MALETTGVLIRYKVRHFADIQLTQTGAGGPRTHKPHERFYFDPANQATTLLLNLLGA